MNSLQQTLSHLTRHPAGKSLTVLSRGIEREALRVDKHGLLAMDEHPKALGSALTHSSITTDYSEALLEFITPVTQSVNELIERLGDIHKFTVSKLDEQYLWPLSMPCQVKDVDKIPLAYYGESHAGKMKTLYRQGLTHRYGAPMQVISGVHFNFSISDDLWQALHDMQGSDLTLEQFRSKGYFDMIRNYRRWVWVLPYLFGASPALCASFLGDKGSDIEFSRIGTGTLYLPHATSLRMSDLGYTNKEQYELGISYNSLEHYLETVSRAIRKPSKEFAKIGVKVDGEYRQLNDNVLQIENELYAPVRPKRVAKGSETPSQALARAGVEYIEVRALDVNPFTPLGISKEQVRLLDLFLLTALLTPSDAIDASEEQEIQANLQKVISHGRDPQLTLARDGQAIGLSQYLAQLFDKFAEVGEWLDSHNDRQPYQDALARWRPCVSDPAQTLSGQLLSQLQQADAPQSHWAMALSKQYNQRFEAYRYRRYTEQEFTEASKQSIEQQLLKEQQDHGSFDEFLKDYFKKALG
ncbi:glutamate--cysteine ligase [Paraferrimonas haliotis]|uniref:Glutamate--cysteine ligase n=1 Tax=Paraferrimonas haliotis TaxID=2013866 RepID=A0AA37TQH7_9GAMM|nr:glutamate--cysteine ligase [Paraferrimonas haliotis]GLS82786.1 glutamate--cysteine ligase [Paraferrimonas haliotis]